MSNLPSDWGSYTRTCSKCGARYHESGTEQCDCEPCEAPKCWELVPPDDYEEQDSLCAAHFEQKLEDEDVETEFTVMTMDEDGVMTTTGGIGVVYEILKRAVGK